ncbi:MAG: hypothetical protein ACHQK9_08660 [Reyranellales bacterium]
MRGIWAIAPILAIIVCGEARAETWQASTELQKGKSGNGCATGNRVHTLELNGTTLVVSNDMGKMVTVAVPSDGMIKQTYKSPTGTQLEISGNVKTRELQIFNLTCPWVFGPRIT